MTWDLLFKDATLIDGTGRPATRGALAIQDGRIAALGATVDGPAHRTVHLGGRVLCPSFIDVHTHHDLSVLEHPQAASALRQGVTTAVVGLCGLSLFPCPEARRAELGRYLSPFTAPAAPEPFADLDAFDRAVAQRGTGINLAPLVGHGTLRLAEAGFDAAPLSPAALARAVAALDRELTCGAFGLSLGLLYPPGSYAAQDELLALAQVVARHDALLTVHLRNEADGLLASVDEALSLAAKASCRLQLSHHKAVGPRNFGRVHDTLARVAAARAQGLTVGLDAWPYRSGSTTITALLPGWVLAGEDTSARLRDPQVRTLVISALKRGEQEGEAFLDLLGFQGIRLARCPARPQDEGRTLADILPGLGTDPYEAFLDWLLAIDLNATMILEEEVLEADVRAVLSDPEACVASDSWLVDEAQGGRPHPRAIACFPYYLSHFALADGALETDLSRLTSLPARTHRIPERGRLCAGLIADLCVLDPTRLRPRNDFANPWPAPDGVDWVLLNGAPAIEEGHLTDLPPEGQRLMPAKPSRLS